MKTFLSILIVLLLILFGVWFFLDTQSQEGVSSDTPNGSEDETPRSDSGDEGGTTLSGYQNSTYAFSLTYPVSWNVATSDDALGPKITFYKNLRETDSQPPFDHFVNETYASVYPQGIPTEGLFGESIPISETDVETSVTLSSDSRVYVLEDGTPFAAYMKLAENAEDKPDTWNDSGYVWLRAYVTNLTTQCLDESGVRLSEFECDPLVENHTIVRNGSVDSTEWNTVVSIAESFSLTTEDQNDALNGDTAQNESIIVNTPKKNALVESPLQLEGEVRGTWLFEATAPVVLKDADGETLGESFIEATENWMTEDFVPFTGTLTFETPTTDTGSISFQKANPSGLPENDASLEYTVRF